MAADPMAKVREALEQGSLSEALRAYREATGVTPDEARVAVQRLLDQPPGEPGEPGAAPYRYGPRQRRQTQGAVMAMLIAVLIAAILVAVLSISTAPSP